MRLFKRSSEGRRVVQHASSFRLRLFGLAGGAGDPIAGLLSDWPLKTLCPGDLDIFRS